MIHIHLKADSDTVGEFFNHLWLNGYKTDMDAYGANMSVSGDDLSYVITMLNDRNIEYAIY